MRDLSEDCCVKTRARFGDRVELLRDLDGWPAGTVGYVRIARVGLALVEILDPDDYTLDLIEVEYTDVRLRRPSRVRRTRAGGVSEGRVAGTPSDRLT